MTSNQIENDAAIDMARRFARSNLEVGQVDLSHLKPARVKWKSHSR
jgi:hypothetical protein